MAAPAAHAAIASRFALTAPAIAKVARVPKNCAVVPCGITARPTVSAANAATLTASGCQRRPSRTSADMAVMAAAAGLSPARSPWPFLLSVAGPKPCTTTTPLPEVSRGKDLEHPLVAGLVEPLIPSGDGTEGFGLQHTDHLICLGTESPGRGGCADRHCQH